MARVTVTLHEAQVSEVELKPGTMTVGRYEDNHICLQDEAVSGHHAKIVTFFQASFIQDLGSTNGTYVNGRRVTVHTLRHGDVVNLGQHHLTYLGDASTTAPAVPQAAMTQVLSREALTQARTPAQTRSMSKPPANAAAVPKTGVSNTAAAGSTAADNPYIQVLAGPTGRRQIPLRDHRTDLGYGVTITRSPQGHVVNRDRRGSSSSSAVRLNGHDLGYEPVQLKNKDTLQLGGDLMAYFGV